MPTGPVGCRRCYRSCECNRFLRELPKCGQPPLRDRAQSGSRTREPGSEPARAVKRKGGRTSPWGVVSMTRSKEVKAMKIRLRHTLAGVGLAGVLVGGSAAVASAATSSSTSETATSTGSAPATAGETPSGPPTFSPRRGTSTGSPPGGSSHCTHMGNNSTEGS
jgi:hypothetical protein